MNTEIGLAAKKNDELRFQKWLEVPKIEFASHRQMLTQARNNADLSRSAVSQNKKSV